jgi:hypothetical protein
MSREPRRDRDRAQSKTRVARVRQRSRAAHQLFALAKVFVEDVLGHRVAQAG